MKRLTLILIASVLCLSAAGQNAVSDFAKTLAGHCATFDYAYSLNGNVPMTGNGMVRLQDGAFTMVGNGLDVRCDGETRWTIDTVSEECYIEDVSGQGLDYDSNPALLVGAVDKAFTLKGTKSATFNGQKVTEASLTPSQKGGNIVSVSLFLTSDKKPAGAVITTSDKSVITITIKNFKTGPVLDMNEFRLDTKKLDKHYIITDLR